MDDVKGGLHLTEEEFDIWHEVPSFKFFCLQQYPDDNKYIGLSDSYWASSKKKLKKFEETIRGALKQKYPKFIYVHEQINNEVKFRKLIREHQN